MMKELKVTYQLDEKNIKHLQKILEIENNERTKSKFLEQLNIEELFERIMESSYFEIENKMNYYEFGKGFKNFEEFEKSEEQIEEEKQKFLKGEQK